jgi:hypothetical protein
MRLRNRSRTPQSPSFGHQAEATTTGKTLFKRKLLLSSSSSSLSLHFTLAQTIATKLHTEGTSASLHNDHASGESPRTNLITSAIKHAETRSPQPELTSPPLPYIPFLAHLPLALPISCFLVELLPWPRRPTWMMI